MENEKTCENSSYDPCLLRAQLRTCPSVEVTIQPVFRSTGVLISSKKTFSELRRAMFSPKGWHHLAEIPGAPKGTRKNFTLVKCPGGCSVCPLLLGPTIFLLRTLPWGRDQDAWLGEWILRNTYPLTGLECSDFFLRVQCLSWYFL